jgi:hypothetical protein
LHATFGADVLNVAEAQVEPLMQPDCTADDFGWKAMPDVEGSALLHPGIELQAELN